MGLLLFGPQANGVPRWQKSPTYLFYSVFARLIRNNLEIGTEVPQTEEKMIREIFDHVDDRLSDGREYIMGKDLTLVDIGFAAMEAPVVLESKYGGGGLLPAFENVSEGMQPLVRELRERPAGRLIARTYRAFR